MERLLFLATPEEPKKIEEDDEDETWYRNRQVSIHLTSLSLSGLLRKIYDPVTMKSVITEYTVLYLFKL